MSFAGGWSDEENDSPTPLTAPSSQSKGSRVSLRGKGLKGSVRNKAKRGRDDSDDDMDIDSEDEQFVSDMRKRIKDDVGVAHAGPSTVKGLGRFHRVTDPDYSDIAIKNPSDITSINDTIKKGWLGSECRCLQCELTRLAGSLSAQTEVTRDIVVLLDLDNFGFPHWVRTPVQMRDFKLPENIFLWGFYGLGFESHGRKGDPNTHITRNSIFGHLRARGQLRLSPCGNYPQAADNAMQCAVSVLRNVHLMVVSADKPNLETCSSRHDRQPILPGKTRKNFAAVNPHEFQDAAAVWRHVASLAEDASQVQEQQPNPNLPKKKKVVRRVVRARKSKA